MAVPGIQLCRARPTAAPTAARGRGGNGDGRRRRPARDRGATLSEYALIMGLVVVVALSVIGRLQNESGSYLVDTGDDIAQPRALAADLDPDLPEPPVWLTQPPPPETTTTTTTTTPTTTAPAPDVIALGGFEEGAQAPSGDFVTYTNGETFGPWQLIGGTASRDHALHQGGGYSTTGHHLDVDQAGIVTRTVTGLTAGTAYELSFVTARHVSVPAGTVSARVVIDGVTLDWSPTTPADTTWTTLTVPFTATSSTVTLTFSGTGSPVNWGGAVVDDPVIRRTVAATTTTTTAPTTTTTTTSSAVPGRLVAAHAGKCLELPGGNTANDVIIILNPCNGSPQQLFTLRSLGDGDIEIITSAGKCLRPLAGSDAWGTRVVQNTCDQTPIARWTHLVAANGLNLRSKPTGLCLDIYGGSTSDGAEAIQWECHGGSNQAFAFDGTIG